MPEDKTVEETEKAAQPVDNDKETAKPAVDDTDWKARSRQWEKQSKENLAKFEALESKMGALAKALLGEEAEEPSVEDLTASQQSALNEARQAKTELALYKASAKHGADADALTDSRKFMAELDQLDASADDFSDQVSETIANFVESNPRYKAAVEEKPAAKPSSGARPNAGTKPPAKKSMRDFVDAGDMAGLEAFLREDGYRG